MCILKHRLPVSGSVEGVEALHNFVEYNFIWKNLWIPSTTSTFREKEGNGAETA